ncbi:putative DEAD-box ATP-dependent RNA helicase 29 [Abeliophyllum distichum]|uniref:DEAD-box ATP-dependent RNA helicase 29 n=1 Tax=Abeliophyllum distichum TaxID=126358 RepID=A0ABD1SV56_9LAMI
MFKNILGGNELTAMAFSERLKEFRPKKTILEAEGEAAKSKHQGSSSQWVDVMKKKRAIHEEVINKVHQQRSTDHATKEVETEDNTTKNKQKQVSGFKRKGNSFKDDEYFISSVPTNQHFEAGLSVRANQGFESNRLEAAVLDLNADDGGGLQKQKSSFHWDKRSKKYVKLNSGERVTASGKIKTESGAKLKANKTGIYKKWKERSHKHVSLKGRSNEGTEEANNFTGRGGGLRGDNRRFKGGKQRLVPNAHVRSEIKDLDQVRKARQKKAERISHLKGSKSKKGKKSGKKGNRGRSK